MISLIRLVETGPTKPRIPDARISGNYGFIRNREPLQEINRKLWGYDWEIVPLPSKTVNLRVILHAD